MVYLSPGSLTTIGVWNGNVLIWNLNNQQFANPAVLTGQWQPVWAVYQPNTSYTQGLWVYPSGTHPAVGNTFYIDSVYDLPGSAIAPIINYVWNFGDGNVNSGADRLAHISGGGSVQRQLRHDRHHRWLNRLYHDREHLMTQLTDPWAPTPQVVADFMWYGFGGSLFTNLAYSIGGITYPPVADVYYSGDHLRYQVTSTPVGTTVIFDAINSLALSTGYGFTGEPGPAGAYPHRYFGALL